MYTVYCLNPIYIGTCHIKWVKTTWPHSISFPFAKYSLLVTQYGYLLTWCLLCARSVALVCTERLPEHSLDGDQDAGRLPASTNGNHILYVLEVLSNFYRILTVHKTSWTLSISVVKRKGIWLTPPKTVSQFSSPSKILCTRLPVEYIVWQF